MSTEQCDRINPKKVSVRAVGAEELQSFMKSEGAVYHRLSTYVEAVLITSRPRLRPWFLPSHCITCIFLHTVVRFPHPHIARVIEALETEERGETSYLILPHVYGNLHLHLAKERSLAPAKARDYFHQIASAVCHCHSHGIALRDLKLGKVMFLDAEESQLALVDLSGSEVVGHSPTVHDQKGSPA